MSTDHRFDGNPSIKDFKKALKKVGLKVYKRKDNQLCVTDGKNYMWVDTDGKKVYGATRYGLNDVDGMLDSVCNELGISYVSEHEDAYWDDEDEDNQIA